MRPLAAMIVDDERLARDSLRQLLAAHPDVTVIAEARDAAQAAARLAANPPDLLFLDIQMPGDSGLEMLERLEDPPLTIFTTAYDAFALRAIELEALDYLLKPVSPRRLSQALERARQRLAALTAPAPAPLDLARQPLRQVFVRDRERCWLVRLADIALFQSEGNYTRLFFAGHRPLIPRALAALESRLDPAMFFRANRAEVVNLRWIEGIEPEVDGGYTLRLRTWPAGRQEQAARGQPGALPLTGADPSTAAPRVALGRRAGENHGASTAPAPDLSGAPEVKVSRRQARRFRELLSL
ncbi:MAG: LytR/AlgR family response regulator transcription factor [Terriglobales bacterium]